jgi:hypothetical protein
LYPSRTLVLRPHRVRHVAPSCSTTTPFDQFGDGGHVAARSFLRRRVVGALPSKRTFSRWLHWRAEFNVVAASQHVKASFDPRTNDLEEGFVGVDELRSRRTFPSPTVFLRCVVHPVSRCAPRPRTPSRLPCAPFDLGERWFLPPRRLGGPRCWPPPTHAPHVRANPSLRAQQPAANGHLCHVSLVIM